MGKAKWVAQALSIQISLHLEVGIPSVPVLFSGGARSRPSTAASSFWVEEVVAHGSGMGSPFA